MWYTGAYFREEKKMILIPKHGLIIGTEIIFYFFLGRKPLLWWYVLEPSIKIIIKSIKKAYVS